MPNRMLRDCTDSDRVNMCSYGAEVLFYRLMMKADDFGSFHGKPPLIRAACYPLRETVKNADIEKWLSELSKSGLIVTYQDAGKQYIRIINFGQRLRNKRYKFPACPEEILQKCGELPQPADNSPRVDDKLRPKYEVEVEVEQEEEGRSTAKPTHTPAENEIFDKLNSWMAKNTPRVKSMKKPLTIDQYLKLKKDFRKDTIQKVLFAMENRGDLHKKYVSANLTIRSWCEREDKPVNGSNIPGAEINTIDTALAEAVKNKMHGNDEQ